MSRLTSAGGGPAPRIVSTPGDKLLPPNLAALCLKAGLDAGPMGENADVQRVARAPLKHFAEASLTAYGIAFDPYDAPENILAAAFAMDGPEHAAIRADGGAYNRPGSFPNLLSALANKILDRGVEAADTTFREWTGRMAREIPDFKPAPIVARSGFGTLDELLDAEALKEQALSEEMLGFLQVARYGNAAKLTPVMAANDDLEAFSDLLQSLADAWERTQNRLCLSLITGNAALLDGIALYDDSGHKNVITSGGAGPSVTTWDAMNQKMAAQTTVGGVAYARARLGVVLVPPKHEVAALQTFLPLGGTIVVENKVAATDSNLNVFRGRVSVAMEPELAAASADAWYGFADPRQARNATVLRGYGAGGEAGRRERWYDPRTKCLNVSLEGRIGAAVKNYRTTVRNPGT